MLIISLLAALCGNIVRKYYTDQKGVGVSGQFLYNAVGSLVAAVALLIFGGFCSASVFTVILAVVFGAVTAIQSITNMAALRIGLCLIRRLLYRSQH